MRDRRFFEIYPPAYWLSVAKHLARACKVLQKDQHLPLSEGSI